MRDGNGRKVSQCPTFQEWFLAMGERVKSTLLKKFFPQILETDMGCPLFCSRFTRGKYSNIDLVNSSPPAPSAEKILFFLGFRLWSDQVDWKRKEKREREIGQGNRGRKRKERGKSNHDYYLLKQRGREKKGTEDCFSCWRSLFYSSAQKCE